MGKENIEANNLLTVTGSITNNAGTSGLIFQMLLNSLSYHNSDNVLATVQRFISGAKEDWHFSSPF
jgi:hypothetical protein